MVTRIYLWSIQVEVWKNLEKKRNTDYDFPPALYVGGKKQLRVLPSICGMFV